MVVRRRSGEGGLRRAIRACALALTLPALVGGLGCNGDDGETSGETATTGADETTADFAGFWQITSIVFAPGEPTITRESAPEAIRGSVEISVITETEGAFRSRNILIDGEGLPIAAPGLVNATFALADDGRWLVSPVDGGLHVYAVDKSDGLLKVDWAADDDRNGADVPTLPIHFELLRRPEPGGKPVGTWNLIRMKLANGEVVEGDACVPTGGTGDTFSHYSLGLDIDRFYGFSRKTSEDVYTDAECVDDVDGVFAWSNGIAEDLDDVLRTWLVLDEGFGDLLEAEYVEYGMSRSGDELTLERFACLPRPDCEANLPLSITVVLTGL